MIKKLNNIKATVPQISGRVKENIQNKANLLLLHPPPFVLC